MLVRSWGRNGRGNDEQDDRGRGRPLLGRSADVLSLYLEPDGSVRRELGGLHALYEFLCEVAAMGTRKAAGKRPGTVRCVSYTASGDCGTPVEVVMEERPRRLVWRCPKCAASGSIRGFEGTRWDRSKPSRRRKATMKMKSATLRGNGL